MSAPKRPIYFKSQFLVVRDFQDEQKYHEESLRNHNCLLHEWGVVRDGLRVTKSGDNFVISPGSAIDSLGREISLEASRTLSAADVQAARQSTGQQDVSITIAFDEANSTESADKYPPPGGTENFTRKVQSPKIVATKSPASDGTVVILARIAADGTVNSTVRKLASSFIPRGTNLGDISLDGTLSFTSKTSPNPQFGLDYDQVGDQLRIRARKDASVLDTTYLTIKRDSGNVGIGTPGAPGHKLEVYGALKLTFTPTVINDNLAAYFWNQHNVGPTIAGFGFEVRTNGDIPRFKIYSSGNVGIGTTSSPGQKLEVAGALKLSTNSTVNNDQSGAYFWNQENVGPTIAGGKFEVRTGGNTVRFRIDGTGNVGIGTTEPATKLHVVGNGSAVPALTGGTQSAGHIARLRGTTTGSTANPVLDIGSGGDKGFWLQSTDPADLTKHYPLLLNPNGGDIGIGTNLSIGGSLGIGGFVSISGDVGIGTSAPRSSLHIRKDNQSGLGPTLTLMNGLGQGGAKVHIDLYTYWDSVHKLPSGRIICEDNAAGSGHLIFQTLDPFADPKKMVERMKIDAASGDVKISGKISCGGKIGIYSPHFKRYISARGAGTQAVTTEADQLKYQEEFTLEMSCSREFKENISDLTALEAMTTLQNLTPVKYDYKGEKAFRQNLGFIAEDMPDNVASEDRKSISPFEVVPILTRVAKEQQRVIAELQDTVRTLQKDLGSKPAKQAQAYSLGREPQD